MLHHVFVGKHRNLLRCAQPELQPERVVTMNATEKTVGPDQQATLRQFLSLPRDRSMPIVAHTDLRCCGRYYRTYGHESLALC